MAEPRILFAAPSSGSGKTMITCGILQALVNRGLKVASFKCGPDYIDPMFHEKVIGTRSGNLDLFFAGEDLMKRLFRRNADGADISVIEGVMGYYDGMGAATAEASSYHVAKTLQAPTVLIVNSRGQSLSALATLKGFLEFQPDSQIRGVIFNQMSDRIFDSLKGEVEKLGVVPLGYLPKASDLVIESRHLGLVTPDEIQDLSQRLQKLAEKLEQTVDMEALLKLASEAPELACAEAPASAEKFPVKIGVAFDDAFCFLYKDNLALLRELGAEIAFFSPIRDKALPEGIQGLLLPGGYPELYARAISENTEMRTAVRQAIEKGMPCLAECGGFMYLHKEVKDDHGDVYPMVGIIDGQVYWTSKLGRFGYITLTAETDSPLISKGQQIRAHEFHYYDSESCGEDFTAKKPAAARSWRCIHAEGNLLAGFPHLFYESNPQIPVQFLRRCQEWEAI